MANEPQRPIEKLLRAWSARRRAQAGPVELHPATRRELQSEVAQTYGKAAAPAGASSWLAGFWLKYTLVGGGAVAVVVALVVIRNLNESPRMELAKADKSQLESARAAIESGGAWSANRPLTTNEPPVSAEALNPFAIWKSGPVAGAGGAGAMPDREGPVDRLAALPVNQIAPAMALVPMPEREVRTAIVRSEAMVPSIVSKSLDAATKAETRSPTSTAALLGVDRESTAMKRAAAPEPTPEGKAMAFAATSPQAAPVGNLTVEMVAKAKAAAPESNAAVAVAAAISIPGSVSLVTQKFARAGDASRLRPNLNSPPRSGILDTFQFEQDGNQVRIVDADGSVYSGQIVGVMLPAPAAPASDRAGRAKAEPGNGGRILFRVLGTNRTEQLRLEFEGSVLLPPPGEKDASGLRDALIEGRAFLGSRMQVEIKAGAER